MKIEKLSEYGISQNTIKKLQEMKIEKLNPAQELAINSGLFEKNIVLSSPTASGKTLVAILSIAKLEKGKAVYIVPLKALASEKYDEFKNFFSDKKVGISTGDYDKSGELLGENDIIILTVEKLDSLLRHKISWINDIKFVIADEIHLLNDSNRGPTLEIVLTRLKKLKPKILALSATIKNVHELANWLNGKAVISNYRPVKLYEGVYSENKIHFLEKKEQKLIGDNEFAVIENTIKNKKQCLVFAGTRKNVESIAEKSGDIIENYLSIQEKESLKKAAEKIKNALGSATKQCKRLAECVKKGSAFHHAGLVNSQRKIIENLFRDNIIKSISATPTLAAGINLPAYRCLIRDTKRFYQGYGLTYIPVLGYQQMIGRAGRPQFDKEGEAILIAKNEREAEELFERYVCGEPEEIYSKLAIEPVLRVHVLALIAGGISGEKELYRFFSSTFYAYQFGETEKIKEIIRNIVEELIEWNFVFSAGMRLEATRIGKRVSELYIDPETAYNFVNALENNEATHFGLLQLICHGREMQPQLRVSNSEYKDIQNIAAIKETELIGNNEIYDDNFLDSIKTALLLEAWINETGEDKIFEKFRVSPGELHSKIQIADWLLYGCIELSLLLGKKENISFINKTRIMLKYGVKKELLPLVRIKNIGRIRARKLWNSNIRSVDDLKKVPLLRLKEIIGDKVAEQVKEILE